MKHILAVGLNPVWGKILIFGKFKPFHVNRASDVVFAAAGKGVNFARAVKIHGSAAKVCQFAGGPTGKSLLSAMKREKIPACTVLAPSPVRCCTTCVCIDSGAMTELIEPSARIGKAHARKLLSKITASLPHASAVALCGTFPEGIVPDFYAEIARMAAGLNIPVLLDAWKDVGPALKAGVSILKINRQELRRITGESSVQKAAGSLFKRHPKIKMIAVTDGQKPSFLLTREGAWKFTIPEIGKIVNSLGAGDAVAGVFLSCLCSGSSPSESFRQGLAAGSASCLEIIPGKFDPQTARRIAGKIKVHPCPSA